MVNIRVTVRKSISIGTLSINWNSVSIVVKRTIEVSVAGAVNADADTGIGLDPDKIADANPILGAGDWVYKITKGDNQLREKEKASEYI